MMNEDSASKVDMEPLHYSPGATTLWNQSWRQLYDHFAQAILAYGRRRGLNDHSAEDVLQEVMMTLIRSQHGQAGNYDPQAGTYQAWLWGVIRNRVRSVRRKDQKEDILPPMSEAEPAGGEAPSLPEIPQPAPDFERSEEDQWKQALLAGALRKMEARVAPENFKIYTALLDERASVEELSLAYGKKPNAIYAVKHRCEEILRGEARTIRAAWDQLRSEPPADCPEKI